MIRFDIIGHGFIDLEQSGGLSFKAENQWFRFADISLGRSVEFSVPATDGNRLLLGFGEDPARRGDMMRASLECQMVYDGGAVMGTLNVTGYEGGAFKCAFILGNAAWLDELQGRQLKDCPCYIGSLYWATDSVVYDADQADQYTHHGRQLLRYDNGLVGSAVNWQLVPSVNVRYFADEILTNMGIRHNLDIPYNLWMVSGSMKGGTEDTVTFEATADDAATVTQTQQYFTVADIDIEWADGFVFGAYVGGGSFPAKGFRASHDVKVTFPQTMPSGVFLIKWDSRLGQCRTLAGETNSGYSGGRNGCPKLQGATVELAEGDIVFFAESTAPDIFIYVEWGWQHTAAPYTFTATVERNGDLQLGEEWFLQFNMPEMTVFEFLKSVALATGLELTVNAANGIRIGQPFFSGKMTRELRDVVSVDSVTRCVGAWGASTGKARVVFDSEGYVESPIVSAYDVPNLHLTDTKDFRSSFSEGATSDNGILIRDVDATSVPAKFAAKKWTLAKVVQGKTYLQRIDTPEVVAYNDISSNSTCVRVKVLASEADFFRLATERELLWLWRGIAYAWTDASWSDGIMTLDLQKVSQPVFRELPPPLPYDAEVEYLESTGTQYIDTGINYDGGAVSIDLDVMILHNNITGNSAVFGVGSNAGNWFGQTTSAQVYGCGSAASNSNINIGNRISANLLYGNGITLTINGNLIGSRGAGFSTNTFKLFKAYPSTSSLAPTRVYSMTMKDANLVFIQDLIPVRVGSVGYMYDRVSGQLFGNSGTGDFILGPDKN